MSDNNDYNIKSIPRTNKGSIDLKKYREEVWYLQQIQTKDIKRINGMLIDHDQRMDIVETNVKVAKILGKISTAIVTLIAIIIGAIAAIKKAF